jgi:hypothetical protein
VTFKNSRGDEIKIVTQARLMLQEPLRVLHVTSMRRTSKPMFTQRGIALIAATTAIAFIAVMVLQLSTSTNLDVAAARNARDQSAPTSWPARRSTSASCSSTCRPTGLSSGDPGMRIIDDDFLVSMLMSAFGGSKEERDSLGESAAMFGMDGLSLGDAKGLGTRWRRQLHGRDHLRRRQRSTSTAAMARAISPKLLKGMIDALYYFPAYDPVFQNPDAEGWRRDRELQTQGADRLRPIATPPSSESRAPPRTTATRASRTLQGQEQLLDTIGELRLIRGVRRSLSGPCSRRPSPSTALQGQPVGVTDPKLIAAIIVLGPRRYDPVAPPTPTSCGCSPTWRPRPAATASRSTRSRACRLHEGSGGQAAGGHRRARRRRPTAAADPRRPAGNEARHRLDATAISRVVKAGPLRTYRVTASGEAESASTFSADPPHHHRGLGHQHRRTRTPEPR